MILIINCGSNKSKYIEQAVDLVCDFQTIGMNDIQTLELDKFDGIIISGSPILVTEVDSTPYQQLFSWIKDYKNPILGICFGHQIIAMIHGAFATRQKEDRDWQKIESLAESPLFNRLPEEFEMMEDHCETVSIPSDFNLIAVSDACVNEGMQHKEKLIFGVQFHPEVSGNMGTLIIENFVNICLEEVKS